MTVIELPRIEQLAGTEARGPRRRIAFISDAVLPFHKGGKETRLHHLSRELAKRGHDVHIYTMKWWAGPDEPVLGGVKFHAICRLHPLYVGGKRSQKQALVFGLSTLRLLRGPYDVLDVDHMPFFPVFGVRLATWIRRRPMIGTWHEVWGRRYWRRYLGSAGHVAYAIEFIATRLPDVIVSNSEHTTRRLSVLAPRAQVRTLPLGVDKTVIADVPPATEGYDIVYAGRLLSHKNVDLLLRAVAELRAESPELRCAIVGEGPERERLGRLAGDLDLDRNVSFFEFFEDYRDLVSILKASKVFVLPSEREGFGLVLLEANACGLPVVTTSHEDNAARHLVEEGQNGCTVDVTPSDLADGIRRCFQLRSEVGPSGPASDWGDVAGQFEDVMAEVAPPRTYSNRAVGRWIRKRASA